MGFVLQEQHALASIHGSFAARQQESYPNHKAIQQPMVQVSEKMGIFKKPVKRNKIDVKSFYAKAKTEGEGS